MRTVRRLRLRFLLLRPSCLNPNGFHIAESSMSLLIALSNPDQAHQKHTIPTRALRGFFHLGQLCASGGPGGSRTHVQNAFTLKELQQFFLVAHNVPRCNLYNARLLMPLHGIPHMSQKFSIVIL